MVFVVFAHIEVDASVGFVGVTAVDNGLDHFDLLNDVAGRTGFDGGRLHVEHPHHVVEIVGVLLDDFHGLEVFESRLLANLILPVVRVPRQVSNICDVANVTHLVPQKGEVAVYDVKCQKRAHIAEVHIAVYGGAAHVHAHVGCVERREQFLFSGEAILDVQRGEFGHLLRLCFRCGGLDHAQLQRKGIPRLCSALELNSVHRRLCLFPNRVQHDGGHLR